MFVVGAGFGLLASQLGNVNMSAVDSADTSEVGGLQGTFQNLGSSFGTAVVGSVFVLMLTSGFTAAVAESDTLPADVRDRVVAASSVGAPILSQEEAEQAMTDAGLPSDAAREVAQAYADSQVESLQQSLFLVFMLTVLGLMLARGLPAQIPVPEAKPVAGGKDPAPSTRREKRAAAATPPVSSTEPGTTKSRRRSER
jgi:hypothetical protein